MNDIVATILALGLIYLVVKFAFGGSSSSSSSRTNQSPHNRPIREPTNATPEQQQQQQQQSQASSSSSSSKKKETLISRYGLESRIADGYISQDSSSDNLPAVAIKGKGKAPNDEDWKKGADKRKDELKRRREEMILEARRKLLEKQQNRASVNDA
ncbi:unnamed protein product [Sympodiomycopsis kandeliae]